eukprot:5643402-Prymnesium_polylepis.1
MPAHAGRVTMPTTTCSQGGSSRFRTMPAAAFYDLSGTWTVLHTGVSAPGSDRTFDPGMRTN